MIRALGLVLVILCAASNQTKADGSLVTDISSHLISVTSDFTGTSLLLFGAIKTADQYGLADHGDIVVVVRGPQKRILVRKKERVAGIWVNTQSVELQKVPSFYAVTSNRQLSEITDEGTLNRLKIGDNRLNLLPAHEAKDPTPYTQAVIRQQNERKLFSIDQSAVYFLGNALFRTSIHFPATVPVGNYIAEVYLFHEGDLISAQTSPLFIKKFGLGRRIYDFAQNYPYIHGIAAIALALFAGWIASAIFRKD